METKLQVTLDEAIKSFEALPNEDNAHILSEVADKYYDDGMIGSDSWTYIQSVLTIAGY